MLKEGKRCPKTGEGTIKEALREGGTCPPEGVEEGEGYRVRHKVMEDSIIRMPLSPPPNDREKL